ncbi:MAG: hypothetical protein ATN32_04590 [Candidatus Epulonipiscium fishelsonii]|nr:MAG: hypothetical protein ATN32_04590 [Epulopiscium sp. AS2M-Bin002]
MEISKRYLKKCLKNVIAMPLTMFSIICIKFNCNEEIKRLNSEKLNIYRVNGGLGNQMFQYAFLLNNKANLKNYNNLIIDQVCGAHNGYELERVFNIKNNTLVNYMYEKNLKIYEIINKNNNFYKFFAKKGSLPIIKILKCSGLKINNIYESNYLENNKKLINYYEGYWVSDKYLKKIAPIIRKTYKFKEFEKDDFPNSQMEKIIKQNCCISIHIRRGDYLNHPSLNMLDERYYYKAISYLKNKEEITHPIFIIFSDDINWIRQNLKNIGLNRETEVYFVDWNKGENSYKDMQLMSMCKHNIIANSTFSWWGAWLNNNPDKIIVCPKHYYNPNYSNSKVLQKEKNYMPKEWIKM